ncbi:esterase-like activity of phytase family protein [Pseudonocardia abyssalis]|uniref:esterase-like activity of phytase family protein n=1 Tax=Pseudonocardia abyssalis TaxID=2792008 RepID=UPI001CF6FBB7|nr:esterase-like activity of phytase family protein [Pseudonocardia abyssalis]
MAALAVAAPPAPEVRCTVTDDRLAELSGMVVADGEVWAMSDGGRSVQVHRLDPGGSGGGCEIVDTRTADVDPFDAEDLALGPDGEFWVADTGDNERSRETVAAIVLPVRGEARLHRFAYPDGPHDAEAMLVDADGVPFVITKEVGTPAGVYRPTSAPEGRGPFPLERVAQVSLPVSDTEGGPVGGIGSRTVTGAAMSTDGRVVALRTYTDAWLFPVVDGDIATALQGEPARVPLAGEPQGEAVTFEADGTLLSASETRGGVPGELRAVPGAAALAAQPFTPPADTPAEPVAEPAPEWLPALIGGGVAVGLLVLLAAALSWRARRR